jgi:hypothetical protein
MPLRASELDAVLNAHAYLRVERPPELWLPATELDPFLRMLGELIAAALQRNGGVLAGVAVNVANVVVEPDAAGALPVGELVALSVSGDGEWPETAWPALVSEGVASAAAAAGAVAGYSRALGRCGSVTVIFRRAAS